MNLKKTLALILALVMALSLVACGSSSAAAPDGSGDGVDQPYAGTTISVVVCTSAFMDNVVAKVGEFEEATGIHVEIEELEDSQVSQKVSVSCAGESGDVDVFGYRPLQDSTLYINNGWLQDLSSFTADPDFDYQDFFQASREATSDVNGVPYGIPYMTEREIVYLNLDLLGQAGYTDGPTTFEELIEMCDKLNDPANGVYAMALRGEGNAAITQFAGFLYAFGGDFFKDGTALVNTPEFLQAIKYYAMLINDYCAPGSQNYGWTDTSNLFCQGSAAMRIDCDSQYAYATNESSSLIYDSVGYSMFPAGPFGSTPFNITAWGLGINSYSEHQGAAWEFIKWATSKEMDVDGMIAGNSSARTSTWENPDATGAYPTELLDVIIATNANENAVSYDRPVMVEGSDARAKIGELLTLAIEGASDEELQAKADSVNDYVQKLLDAE
ncbi:MAG: sugar ABC transporter substrate-binding protein [Oscillospiraceae bacterium]|nr:sugar ABC transporter substrate-binding protein [Oscillospiraceae bacterium]